MLYVLKRDTQGSRNLLKRKKKKDSYQTVLGSFKERKKKKLVDD